MQIWKVLTFYLLASSLAYAGDQTARHLIWGGEQFTTTGTTSTAIDTTRLKDGAVFVHLVPETPSERITITQKWEPTAIDGSSWITSYVYPATSGNTGGYKTWVEGVDPPVIAFKIEDMQPMTRFHLFAETQTGTARVTATAIIVREFPD